ncbi:hypothetical protein [Streptomyces griseocarneus]|uniref:hypothetical protein n=1 Tax=Streptomyces griseocarneus TaxID=51201 RepID=UPI00167D74B4|nr:hypothetical protein [Streptomyces griseocarneus]MBZ6477525.1 hypothetical protein [Streptomyces griseocarneus]GHG82689.1 hypothetical protein GCM10018779_65550 [Streptomyces griseocarneus]
MKAGQQTGQGTRTLRAGVFAAVCVLLAALGHAVMSGTTVPWWAIAVALTGTGSCAWFLAGRERGPLLITLATVGAQTGLHSFFSLAQNVVRNAASLSSGPLPQVAGDATCGGIPPADLGMDVGAGAGMAAAPMAMDHTMSMGMGMGGMHAGHGALGMWSAHVLVALVCGLWLAGGEQAAFRLGRTLGARLFAPLLFLFQDVPARPGPPRVRASLERAAQRLRQLLYAHVLAQRGPPAVLVAVA